MALTYGFAGFSVNPQSNITQQVQTGSFSVILEVDDDLLESGDAFSVSSIPGLFSYEGTDGSGGIVATNLTEGGRLWLSNNQIFQNDTIPPGDGQDTIICFAAGTLIATPDGERAVEMLSIGDLVTTADGDAVPVKWTGRQTFHTRLCSPERIAPVRITAGALGNGLPHADLLLTSCHAVILHGLAITAGALVNGTTIIREPVTALPDTVTYWHVETEGHRVILANGAPAETYLDYENRRAFDNYDEYVALYGDQPGIEEMNLLRITSARLVPAAIQRQLAGLVPA